MAVTGTTTYTVDRDQIITYALRKIGALELGATADSTTISAYTDPLNMMIKSWITKGIKLWTVTELTLPFTASKRVYIIGNTGTTEFGTPDLVANKPMELIQAWLVNVSVTPNNRIPLQVISRKNYNEFGSPDSTGTPNSVFMEVGRDQSRIKVYVSPDSVAATDYQLQFVTQREIYDMTNSTDNFDFPVEWLYALGWNFAAEIATDFGVSQQRLAFIEAKANKFLSEVEAYDVEKNSIYFTPDMRYTKR